MLNISNLNVNINNKIILNNLNLNINEDEIHVIMGPNGAGKSTICKTIIGDGEYTTSGSIIFNEEELLNMDITSRARRGIFLLDQSPMAIEGVTNAEMLRAVLLETNDKPKPIFEFYNELKEICKKISLDESFINRNINEGMSGGERKKNELLHMHALKPKLVILDEIDSGLDIDSLKVVSKAILEYKKEYNASVLIITHHTSILSYIKPNYVHILKDGKIKETGNINLALKIEAEGFEGI